LHNVRGDCSIRVGGLGFSPEEIAACAEREGLLSLEIDLALPGSCHCRSCQSSPQFARSTLTLQEIRDLLGQARELGARRCFLTDSEPSSHAELQQIIDAVRDNEMQVELFARAAAISEPVARFLAQRDVAVILTVNSMDRDLQNRLAGDENAHDAIHAALSNLMHAGYCETAAPRLAIRIEVCDDNLSEVPALWRWVRSQKMEPYVQIITPPHAPGQTLKIIAPNTARHLFENLGRIDAAEFQRQWAAPPSLIGRSCKRHLFACHVTPCGTIFACVGLTIPLGNIRAESLHEILNLSEVLESLRAFGQELKEPCLSCSKTTDCYGCRGSAYQLTGDYLAGDQLCWKADGVKIESLPTDVANLVPHGMSMRVIDQLVQIGERCAKTEAVVRPNTLLVDASGRLDELAYIEMIAQSFAASHTFHLSEEARRVHRGLLLGVKDFVVSGEARVGDRLNVSIRKITRFGDFGVIEGEVHHQDGRLIAAGQVKIWRPSTEFLEKMTP
jgi:radical SAM protein with 4Fe4S-binding SPASM domain